MRWRSPAQISSVPRGHNPRVNTEPCNLHNAFDSTHLIPQVVWSKKKTPSLRIKQVDEFVSTVASKSRTSADSYLEPATENHKHNAHNSNDLQNYGSQQWETITFRKTYAIFLKMPTMPLGLNLKHRTWSMQYCALRPERRQ